MKIKFKVMYSQNRFLKIIAVLAYIFLTIASGMLAAPATGYELSVYHNINTFVWILLIGSNICGMTIIIHQAFSKNINNFWLIGLSILIFGNLIILSLQTIRGYYLYNLGDALNHLQIATDIMSNGYFDNENAYPIVHLLTVEIAKISNISPVAIMRCIPTVFSILFIVFVYMLSKSILSKRQLLLATVASVPFLFTYYHITVYPSGFSVLMLPLILYLYFRHSEKSFRLLLIIFLILYPFFHPSTASMLILFLVILELIKGLYTRKVSNISFELILVSVISYITWISLFWIFGESVRSIYSMVRGESEDTYFIEEGSRAVQNIKGFELVELFIKMYGSNVLYMILSFVAIILIIKRRRSFNEKKLMNIYMLSMIFVASMPISYFLFASSKLTSVGRLLGLNYTMIIAPILIGYMFCEMCCSKKNMIFIILILTSTWTLSMFGMYRSPWVLQQNWQVSYSYDHGSKWFSDHNSQDFVSNGMGYYRASMPPYYRYGNDPERVIPEHFNYTYRKMLGESFNKNRYLVVTQISKLANADATLARYRMDPNIQWGFDMADFDKLEYDVSIDTLYSNGEFWVYFIKTGGKK